MTVKYSYIKGIWIVVSLGTILLDGSACCWENLDIECKLL